MKTLMHKFELSENRVVNLLMDFYIGFDISKKTQEELLNLVDQNTEVSYSIGAYTKDGEHGGHFPKEFSSLPEKKFPVSELVNVLNSLGSSITVEELNVLLLTDMLLRPEYVNSYGKIEEALSML
jgi:hypothetical protein